MINNALSINTSVPFKALLPFSLFDRELVEDRTDPYHVLQVKTGDGFKRKRFLSAPDMSDSLYLNGVTVNSEANARRIGLVEGCFGSAGQPLAVPGQIIS